MSKAYGLAGLRVGSAIAHPDLITSIDKVAAPFAIPGVSQAAAVAALLPAAQAELSQRVGLIRSERTRVVTELRALGFDVPPSQANLVWLPVGAKALDTFAVLERAGVVSRMFDGDGVRITIGAPAENDMVIEALRGIASTR